MADESVIPGLIGSSVGEAAAFAAGLAIAPLLEPYLQELRNVTWSGTPTRPLSPDVPATAVAERLLDEPTGAKEASQSGMALTPFRTLVETLIAAPGTGELLQMLRRGTVSADNFTYGLGKAHLDPRFDAGIRDLRYVHLPPANVALGIVRNIFPDPGFLPVTKDLSGGVVPAYQQTDLDAVSEAAVYGMTREDLRVMVGTSGLPMALGNAASAFFRGIIRKPDYYRAVAEGDTRIEWADSILDQSRQILTASEYAELELRGFLSSDERLGLTDQTGMSHANSNLLYNLLGRSIPVHQITTGLARGGVYKGSADAIPESYLSSLQRGNLRPEYYNLAYANRYSLPSAFVIRALLTGGAITAAEGETLFLESGWKPSLAKQVAEFYGPTTTATADPNVKKAQTQLWTATHRSFIAGETDEATVVSNLTTLGVPAEARSEVVALWTLEQDLVRKQLTPAQIKKGFDKAAINDATGQPWTHDDALAALLERGYSGEQARSYLNLPAAK